MQKILFSDIDGTLLDKNRNISSETYEAYQSIRHQADLVLISSRMPKAMTYFQTALQNETMPLVCYNGGLVLKNGLSDYLNTKNILLDILISTTTVRLINEYLEQFSVNFSVYEYDNWYTTKNDYWTQREENNTRAKATVVSPNFFKNQKVNAHKIMIMGKKVEIDEIYSYLEKEFPQVDLYRAKDTYIEVASHETSKGKGVNIVLNQVYSNIAKEDTFGFGDNYNDVPLFEAVGFCVAMGNARPELKAIANAVTLTNKEHGVARFLNEYFKL
ncbi:MAG: Cof-type HAD-IIB family hydrolase [Saprospiraceae bacterium]